LRAAAHDRSESTRPLGIDNSEAQLRTARALQREFGLEFPLLHGNAEEVPLPCFGTHRFEWSDDDSVEFHLPHGAMIALLRRSGFAVQELREIRPPDGSTTRFPFITLEWAQRWPCEEVWKARKLG
jgi:hypothetical protein